MSIFPKELEEIHSREQLLQQSPIRDILERENAVISCFGAKALLSDKEILLSSGELVMAWGLDGICEADDLRSVYSMDIIIDIYDSGL